MDALGVTIGIIAGGIIAFIGFILGVYAESMVRRQVAPAPQAPQVPVPEKPAQREKEKKPKIPPGGLGAVPAPTAEDLEKKEKPILKEEEEAWGEDIQDLPVMAESVAAVFKHPNTTLLF